MLGGWELCEGYADRIREHRQGHTLYEGLVLFVSVALLHIQHAAHPRRGVAGQATGLPPSGSGFCAIIFTTCGRPLCA